MFRSSRSSRGQRRWSNKPSSHFDNSFDDSAARSNRDTRRAQVQQQGYKQDTKKLQSQMLFMEQAKATFVVVESHLDHLANDADPKILTATSSGVVACLNLMRNTAMNRDDREGNLAIKSILSEFNEKCKMKYAEVPHDKREKMERFQDAVMRHLVSVLNGDSNTPLMGVAPVESVSDSESEGTEEVVSRSMAEFMRGNHELAELERDVEENSSKYREQITTAARDGARFEQEEEVHAGSFDARQVSILQRDMGSVGGVRDERVNEMEALATLKQLNARSRAFENSQFDGNEYGEPDLFDGDTCEHHSGMVDGVQDMDEDEPQPGQPRFFGLF